jgi:hypothetical protein
MRKVHTNYEIEQRRLISSIEEANGIPNLHSHVARRRAAATGNMKILMIPFKFSNHGSRVVPSTADLAVLMNNVGPHSLCPTGSVRDVYLASSFNQLILDTTVAPWVTLPNTETYYAGVNSGLSTTAHTMIKDALNALQAIGFDFTQFDTNNDGYIVLKNGGSFSFLDSSTFTVGKPPIAQPATPFKPAPTKPIPVKPAPTKPTPVKPAPTKPSPVKPAPTKPSPVKPAPTKPTPTKPTPVKPAPTKPTPIKPTPTKPTPIKPAPSLRSQLQFP